MKVAMLTPLKFGEERSSNAVQQAIELSALGLIHIDTNIVWNDYCNRMTLLAAAMAEGCQWVVWIDNDEEVRITGNILTALISEARQSGAVAITFRVREMWNQTHYRSDGIWGTKRRVVVQKNPLMEGFVHWRSDWKQRLHSWPLQMGPVINSEHELIHWGMSTPELRLARVEKYRKADPKNEFQPMGYEYMLSTEGIELTPL